MSMKELLNRAAGAGDVNFLREVASDYNFLVQCLKESSDGNIFHLAATNEKVDFFKEAMKLLSKEHLKLFLFEKDHRGWTPLHLAAANVKNCHVMVKLILDFYTSLSIDDANAVGKPWLALTTKDKLTPLHAALLNGSKDSAMEIVSMDAELLSTMVDADGNSPLFIAVWSECNEVAEKILISCPVSCSVISGENGLTALHVARYLSEKVWRLLLKKFGHCIDKTDGEGKNVLHVWARDYGEWLCKLLLEIRDFPEARTKMFRNLICSPYLFDGDTPLHIATRKRDPKLAQMLVQGYQLYTSENQEVASVECPPWRIKNKVGDTPLHIALYPDLRHEEFAKEILSIDPTLCRVCNNKGESPFFLAFRHGFDRVVDVMLRIEEPRFDMLHGDDGLKVLHNLPSYSENVWRLLLKNCGDCIDKTDNKGNNMLHVWVDKYRVWLCELLLEVKKYPKARTKIFGNLICSPNLSDGDTPLHLATWKIEPKLAQMLVQGYQQFMSENQEVVSVECPPWRVKNKFGDTPLHIAMRPDVRC